MGKKAMNSRYAHIIQALHPIAQRLGSKRSLFRNWQIAGTCCSNKNRTVASRMG